MNKLEAFIGKLTDEETQQLLALCLLETDPDELAQAVIVAYDEAEVKELLAHLEGEYA